jgi:hypothetical protein
MSAYVRTAAYIDRSARVICEECSIDETYPRTEPAQVAARAHNEAVHAYPEPLPMEPA